MKKSIIIIIGLLFVVSGFLKAIDTMAFTQTFTSYGLINGTYIAPVIAGFEVFIGLCWLLGVEQKLTLWLTFLLTMVFSVVIVYGQQVGGIEDCGCMGTMVKTPIWVALIRNLGILLACIYLWRSLPKVKKTISNYSWILLIAGSSIGFGLAGFTAGIEIYNRDNIQIGESIRNTFLVEFEDKLPNSTGYIFIFSPNCPHCWNATENVKSIQTLQNNVIGISSIDAYAVDYINKVKPNFEIYTTETQKIQDAIKTIPVLVEIQNGKITQLYKSGHIPSGEFLKLYAK